METTVLTERRGAVAILTLNRQDARNAMNGEMRRALAAAFREFEADEEIGAAVIVGAGSRAFCAGQDIKEAGAVEPSGLRDWLLEQRECYQAIRDFGGGVVVALNGDAFGVGFHLALLADIRVGAAGIRLGQTEIRFGLASVVGLYLAQLHLPLSQATEMCLLGRPMTGDRARHFGLLNELSDPAEVLNRAVALASDLASMPRLALRLTRERIRLSTQTEFDRAFDSVIGCHLQDYASGEPQRAMATFLAGRSRG